MGGYLSRMPFPPPPPTILSCNFQPPTPSRFLYDPWWQWQLLLSQNFMPNKHFSKNIQLMKSPALNDKELTKLSHPASAAITWCWSKPISIQLLWLRHILSASNNLGFVLLCCDADLITLCSVLNLGSPEDVLIASDYRHTARRRSSWQKDCQMVPLCNNLHTTHCWQIKSWFVRRDRPGSGGAIYGVQSTIPSRLSDCGFQEELGNISRYREKKFLTRWSEIRPVVKFLLIGYLGWCVVGPVQEKLPISRQYGPNFQTRRR